MSRRFAEHNRFHDEAESAPSRLEELTLDQRLLTLDRRLLARERNRSG